MNAAAVIKIIAERMMIFFILNCLMYYQY